MMESQIELDSKRIELLDKFKQALPDLSAAQYAMLDEVYKDGALSSKVKRLISLAVALRAGCTNCILAQTKRALETEATKDEILETLSVAVAMSGNTGVAESLRVVELLSELGKL